MTEGSRLLSTDSEGFEFWETPKGNFWVPPKGGIYNLSYLLAEHECKIYGSGKVGVRAGDIVLDCGANVGTYTREALNAGAKLVVAIEPSPNNIKCLHQNFKTEVEQGRVIIYEKGVWNREEILTFHTSASSVLDSFVLPLKDSDTIYVPVTTIDKLVKELKMDRVDFIKLDIEGSEENALLGAKETIGNYGPRIALSLEHTGDNAEQVSRMLRIIKSSYVNYQNQCGDCGFTREGKLYPHVMFFY